jgi:hypothetical protein
VAIGDANNDGQNEVVCQLYHRSPHIRGLIMYKYNSGNWDTTTIDANTNNAGGYGLAIGKVSGEATNSIYYGFGVNLKKAHFNGATWDTATIFAGVPADVHYVRGNPAIGDFDDAFPGNELLVPFAQTGADTTTDRSRVTELYYDGGWVANVLLDTIGIVRSAGVGDVDNDADVEGLAGTANYDPRRVYLLEGSGGIFDVNPILENGLSAYSVAFGDFDSWYAGNEIVVGQGAGTITKLHGSGSTWATETIFESAEGNPQIFVTVGDADATHTGREVVVGDVSGRILVLKERARVAHDCSADAVLSPLPEAPPPTYDVEVQATVTNRGMNPESNLWVRAEIRDAGLTVVYRDSVQVGALGVDQRDTVTFSNWTVPEEGSYAVKITTLLPGDGYPANDTASLSTTSTYTYELAYDDGTAQSTMWGLTTAGQALGVRFSPFQPCSLLTVKYYIQGCDSTHIYILDDNGPLGMPGDTLRDLGVVPVNVASGWDSVDLSGDPLALPAPGSFYAVLVWINPADSGGGFMGFDNTPPLDYQSYQYSSGTWALWYDSQNPPAYYTDCMMRARVRYYGTDLFPPVFSQTTQLIDNYSITGPYKVHSLITDPHGVDSTSLHYSTDGGGHWTGVSMNYEDGFYRAEIPGQAFGSTIYYYVHGVDGVGNAGSFPLGAPDTSHCFRFRIRVPRPLPLVEGFEAPGNPLANWIPIGTQVGTETWSVHGGANAAILGDTTRPGIEYYGDLKLYTGVIVPSVGPCSLHCWVKLGSYEKNITWDWQNLEIRNAAADSVLHTVLHVCDSSETWQEISQDLMPWAGQTVVVYLLVHGDLSYLHTWMLVDDFQVLTGVGEGGGEGAGVAPVAFALSASRPNPTSGPASLSFALPARSRVAIRVYDITGALVRKVSSDIREAGTHRVVWDLRDDFGRAKSSGVYFWHLRAGPFEGTRRFTVVR